MFDIYEENSLVIAIRKSLSSEQKSEEAQLQSMAYKYIDRNESSIYLPFFDATTTKEDNDKTRYVFDKDDKLVSVQVEINSSYLQAVYLLNISQLKTLYHTWKDDFEFLCYSRTTEILRNEILTMYGIMIDENPGLSNKLAICYDSKGYLQRISVKNDHDQIFFETLTDTDINQLKDFIQIESERFIIDKIENYSRKEGEICFIALEYFYDGEAIDIGLRLGLQKERMELAKEYTDPVDIREYTGDYKFYAPILDSQEVEHQVQRLFQYFKRVDFVEGSSVTYNTIEELATEITVILKRRDWSKHAYISSDLQVLGPFEYD